MRIFVVIGLLTSSVSGISQTFEVATIKTHDPNGPIQFSGCQGGPGSNTPGRIRCEYVSLKNLISAAYRIKAYQIVGPSWLDSGNFDMTATVPAGASKEDVPAMYQALLADRFKLKLHREDRDIPIYALTVTKEGSKLSVAAANPVTTEPAPAGPPKKGDDGFVILRPAMLKGGPITLFNRGKAKLSAANETAAGLASALTYQTDRLVVDETGLTGRYDVTLYWTSGQKSINQTPSAPQEASLPEDDLFMGVQHQLGLRLVPKKKSMDCLVIDSAEKSPSEN